MHVQTEDRLNRPLPNLSETLERMRLALGYNNRQWAEQLELTASEYFALRTKSASPLAPTILRLADKYDLAFDKVMSGQIDFKALSARHAGTSACLPETYAIGAFSRRRTSINVLEYVDLFFGWKAKRRLLRHFQLNEAVFADPEKKISLKFLMDCCKYLQDKGCSDQDLFEMGAFGAVTNRNSSFISEFAKPNDQSKIYEHFFTHIVNQHYDQNFKYHLVKLDKSGCILEIRDNQEVNDALKLNHLGNKALCSLRQGSIASLPKYAGMSLSKVRKLSCVHRGDDKCRYEIVFAQPARRAQLHKRSTPHSSSGNGHFGRA